MSELKITFGDPMHGWMALNIHAGNMVLELDVSDIYPSFCLLMDALHSLRVSEVEKLVTWTCEPTEYDFLFQRTGNIIALLVNVYPGTSRLASAQSPVLTVSGTYDEICLPFWRALRGLQSRFTKTELEERWTNTFPYEELDKLTELLGKG